MHLLSEIYIMLKKLDFQRYKKVRVLALLLKGASLIFAKKANRHKNPY